jgi:hypothetical protein
VLFARRLNGQLCSLPVIGRTLLVVQ